MTSSILFRTVNGWVAAALASVLGLAYATILLGPDVVLGTSDYWRSPQGNSGGLLDMKWAMSGYFWFVQDDWRWPLFHVDRVNGPTGANVALVDPVPILALAAKVFRSMTGIVLNLFPVWVAATFALNAAALTVLVRTLGQRSILAAVLSAGLAAMAPVIHHRFGHFGHAAHWVFIFALAIYFAWSARPRTTFAEPLGLVALCLLAVGINLYLYVMTAAIAAAWLLQAVARRSIPLPAAAAGMLAVLGAGVAPLWAFGLLSNPDLAQVTIPFGEDSMNLMAPFWPQTSGAFSWTGLYLLTRGSIGATKGQYEGYCYLGLGALILLAVAGWTNRRIIPTLIGRHWALVLALATLTLWAISNRVYFGSVLVASYPLPDWLLNTVLAWFRAGGRFFWPVAWLAVGLAIAGTLAALRPRHAAGIAMLALLLQWIDISIWRDRLQTLTSQAPVSAFGTRTEAAALEAEIARLGQVAVVPSMMCNANGGGDYNAPDTQGAMEVQLMAARSNATMPYIALARGAALCPTERSTPLPAVAESGLLIALAQPGELDRTEEARRTMSCRSVSIGWVCTAIPGTAKIKQ